MEYCNQELIFMVTTQTEKRNKKKTFQKEERENGKRTNEFLLPGLCPTL